MASRESASARSDPLHFHYSVKANIFLPTSTLTITIDREPVWLVFLALVHPGFSLNFAL